MIVKLKDIQFHSDIIVKKAKLELLSGNLTALIGESGSGKSTIIDSIIFENEFLESFMYQDKDYAKATKE
ncbi:ATP-binding protein, partial [[Eubacterium] hominis]